MGKLVTLSEPIEMDGKRITILEFRKANGADMRIVGQFPFATLENKDGATMVQINSGATADYIARLADIPMSAVDQLSPIDFLACFKVIVSGFHPAERGKGG